MSRNQFPPNTTQDHIDELVKTLCLQHQISPVPKVEWSKRLKKVLGKANINTRTIKLSSWLNFDQADETLRHELAHIALSRNLPKPHGPEWKQMALQLGAKPRATSPSPPANVHFSKSVKILKGLECPSGSVRLTRHVVKHRLYCKACGPKNGILIKKISGTHHELMNWLMEVTENA